MMFCVVCVCLLGEKKKGNRREKKNGERERRPSIPSCCEARRVATRFLEPCASGGLSCCDASFFLVQEGDPAPYVELLRKAVIGMPPSVPDDDEALVLLQKESHQSLINGLVAELAENNVLRLGMWQGECAWPNSALNAVRGLSWQLLHERIGSDLLRYILKETSVFVPMANNCYLQLCGIPLNTLLVTLSGKPSSSVSIDRVSRSRIFYDERFIKKPGFSGQHVLCHLTCAPSVSFARHLCRIIFQTGAQHGRLHKRYRGMVVPMQQLIHNHMKLRYGFFLRIYGSLVKHTEPFQVVCFVWACIARLVPRSIWGCDENFATGRKMVDGFVRLLRFDEFDIGPWVAKWRMKPCAWIPRTHGVAAANQFVAHQKMVRQWLLWMVNELVIPLIRNHFYVTESTMYRNKIFFYRKPLWKQIVDVDMANRVEDGMYCSLPRQTGSLPVPRLRLLPKATGMRAISNLSARGGGKGDDSANFLLKPTFEALRWELFQNGKKHLLGSSVFNMSEAHARILPFVEWFRRDDKQLLFFVSVDVKASFDSVNQDKLCSILFNNGEERIFEKERYVLQRYTSVGQRSTLFKTACSPASEMQPLRNMTSLLRNSVVVDSANCEFVSRVSIEARLKEHITRNIVHFRGRYYLQEEGIPQGSVLSSLLCSLYYGHMERYTLADLPIQFSDGVDSDKGVLMRFIDDSLFVTTSKAAAVEFVRRMHVANDEYGIRLNAEKTLVNFECNLLPRAVSDAGLPTQNPCIPWCGVLVDTVTMEFYADYTRYRSNYVNESLTAVTTGEALREKIKQLARPKCISLLLDSRINSMQVIWINVYQIFLLTAIKFHCLVRRMPGMLNPRFLLDVIMDVVEFTNALIQSQTRNLAYVRFLGRHAFYTILKRKQAGCSYVVKALSFELDEQLRAATDPDRHKLLLREILF